MASATQSIRQTKSTPSAESIGIQYENGELKARRSDVPSLECIYALAALSEGVRRTLVRHAYRSNDVRATPVELRGVIPIISSSDGSTRGAPQRIDAKLRQNLDPGSCSESDIVDRSVIDAGCSSCVGMKESFLASQSIIRILPLSRYYLSPGQGDATNSVNANSKGKLYPANGVSSSAEHSDRRSGIITDCSIEQSTAHIKTPSEHLHGSIEDILGKPYDGSIKAFESRLRGPQRK